MNKQEVYAFLKSQNIPFEITEHKAVFNILQLTPGSVTPLGLLNDPDNKVKFFLDKGFLEEPGLIGVQPNDNTATVWLKTADLLRLIREHGNEIETVEL